MKKPLMPIARLAAVLCTVAILTLAPQLHAGDKKAGGEARVKVSVVAILASETSAKIDQRLDGIAAEIRKAHPQLTGFRMAKMTCKSVEVSGSETFELVTNQFATVTVMKEADKENWVQLKVTPPTLGEINYTTICGKFFPIVTQHRTDAKELLIIAVRVQPCNGKK
jgi:hypothetical protein